MTDLVLGVNHDGSLLKSSEKLFSEHSFLSESPLLKGAGKLSWAKCGTVRIEYLHLNETLKAKYKRVVLVSIGKPDEKELSISSQYDFEEDVDLPCRIRNAVSKAVGAILNDVHKDEKESIEIVLDNFDGHEQVVGEGAVLGQWKFSLKYEDYIKKNEKEIFKLASGKTEDFKRGLLFATSQKFARFLSELPSNYLTPTKYCDLVAKRIEDLGLKDKIKFAVHDKKWAEEQKMGLFLGVAKGSDEPPRVLEMYYTNNKNRKEDEIDIFFVGKGITFDTGGICIKPSASMQTMKSDMGGSSVLINTFLGAVKMGLPLNIGLIAMMTDNMPDGKAIKPGDVLTARNGKTVEVENTDAEGRLILADALIYASEKKPTVIINAATLTGAIGIAIGREATGLFSNRSDFAKLISKSGYLTNDYFWRMPIFRDVFLDQLKSKVSDINNVGGRSGGACSAATFLGQFVDFTKVKAWAHLDIAGVTWGKSDDVTGRPTRALLHLLSNWKFEI
jgi:aminopeptidase